MTSSPQNSTTNTSPKDHVQLAENQDSDLVLGKLENLLTSAHPWHLCQEGKGIQRSFHFKTFKQTWEFMSAVADQCKVQRHHPEWWNAYNTTFIQWTTHKPLGLTIKDVDMAKVCDDLAAGQGELEVGERVKRKLFGVGEVDV